MLKSAFGRLSTGVCRQPQWVYVGVFMYSLAGWSFGLPADYAPAYADSRSGFMSRCLCIHWPGEAGSTVRIISYNSRGDALTTVYGFLRGLLMYLQPEYNCISRETVSYTSRGTIPHIVPNYPRAYIQRRTEHFRGCLQTPVLNPPKADFSIRCACNQTKVCRRKGSGRRHPSESVPTEVFWPADSDGSVLAGGIRRLSYFRSNTGIMSSGALQVIVSEPS